MRFVTFTDEEGNDITLNAAAFESVKQCHEDGLENARDHREIRTRGGNYFYVTETVVEITAAIAHATQRN